MSDFQSGRAFLKSDNWQDGDKEGTDQQRGVPQPPLEVSPPDGAPVVDLVAPRDVAIGEIPLADAIGHRRSRRRFSDQALSQEELSFLLWATQGVHRVIREGYATLRSVPSAGARHPFETYLLIQDIEGLEPGLYRYLALRHKLCHLGTVADMPERIKQACLGQQFVAQAAVVFAWVAVPYRTEWRYGGRSHKVIALDAGHICQNLYLACEAIQAGTCAIGAYDQAKTDALFGLDGQEQFVVYLAPVGKLTAVQRGEAG